MDIQIGDIIRFQFQNGTAEGKVIAIEITPRSTRYTVVHGEVVSVIYKQAIIEAEDN